MIRFLPAWWRSMGIWRWLNLSIVVYACFLAINYEAVPDRWVNHGRQYLAGLDIRFYTSGRIIPGEQLNAKIEVAGKAELRVGFQSFESTFLSIQSDNNETEFALSTPEVTSEQLSIVVVDEDENSVAWNLGRLY